MWISKTSNKVKATWSASVRTPAAIAEHIVQASLWLVWGKQERPSFTNINQKYRSTKASDNYSFLFSSAWGVGLGNLFGHPKHATMLGTPHSKDWLLTGDPWVNRTRVWRRRELASSLFVSLRIRCPGATRSCGTEADNILGRTSCSHVTPLGPQQREQERCFICPKGTWPVLAIMSYWWVSLCPPREL